MIDTILVVGGTGLLGRPVVRQLLIDGFRVRVFARSTPRESRPGDVEFVPGDVTDADAVNSAVLGCTGVHVTLSGRTSADLERVEHRGTANVAAAAARHHLDRVSYVSGSLVNEEYGEKTPEHRAKAAAEEAIRRSDVPFVFFRPSYFIDNLPRHIQGGMAVVVGRPKPLHMVAASDFARMVSRAFRLPDAVNREFYVQGPEAITIKEALGLYCSLVETDKRVIRLPLSAMSAIDRFLMGGKLRASLDIMSLLQRLGERGKPTEANELLGAPTMTVTEWCKQQARDRARTGA